MENQKLLQAEATQEQEMFTQPTIDDIAKENDEAAKVRAAHGLVAGQIRYDGYGEGKVGYVDSIDEMSGRAQIKIMTREAAEARTPKTVEEASEINEQRDTRLQAFDDAVNKADNVVDLAERRRDSKNKRRALTAGLALAATGILPIAAAANDEAPRDSAAVEQFDAGHSPYRTAEAQEADTFPQSAVTEQERYEQMLKKQYAEDDKLSTFDSKNKISEKAFGESPLVEGDAFATWEKGMDQLNHNSAAQAHVMSNLPDALKQELRIDGQRLSDLSTEQLQKIFDTNLQARDTLVSTVTDMIEDGDVSLEMVTKNTAYRSYHIQVDENGKKHVVETPYLPQAEREVLILGYGQEDDSTQLNVPCSFQVRSDIAPEQVATAIAAAAVATQAPSQPGTPTTPETPGTPDTPTTPDEPNTPNTPNTPDKPNKPEEPNTPGEPETPPEKPGKSPEESTAATGNNQQEGGLGQAPPVDEEASGPAVGIGEGNPEDPTNIPDSIIAPEVEGITGAPATPGVDSGLPEGTNPEGADEDGRADGTITE